MILSLFGSKPVVSKSKAVKVDNSRDSNRSFVFNGMLSRKIKS